ncbi:ABC-2 family transporter protein [Metalysinibacillus saudimassiliensis]|uniref:ABC-2 family transporter protein n=1 Tax=Metalysinibacillus saudimassiliensis TaxID=1461583 RepID=A0A078M7N7_9BACL|nr:ABC-2 family transporter protein [Metalysinibacillus saudimassiliensis]
MSIRLKKQWPRLMLALLLPILLTYMVLALLPKAELRIPVGLVMEEQTALANMLVTTLQESPVLSIQLVTKKQALQQVETHEVDSVFIINDGFEATILANERRTIVEGYRSNMSLMYEVASELVSSRTLQLIGQYHTVATIQQMTKHAPDATTIIAGSNAYFKEHPILSTAIHYTDASAPVAPDEHRHALIIWALFTSLATFMQSEWLRKELTPTLKLRLPFSKLSVTRYILTLALSYTLFFLLVDGIALLLFATFSAKTVLALIAFRLTLVTIGYTFALLSKSALGLYQLSLLGMSLLFFTSGLLLAVPDSVRYLHPLVALDTTSVSVWLILAPAWFLLLLRKEVRYV